MWSVVCVVCVVYMCVWLICSVCGNTSTVGAEGRAGQLQQLCRSPTAASSALFSARVTCWSYLTGYGNII